MKEFVLLVVEMTLKFNAQILNLLPGMASPAAAFWVCGRSLEKRRIDRAEWNEWYEQKKD